MAKETKSEAMDAKQLAAAYKEANAEAQSFASILDGIVAKQKMSTDEAAIYNNYTKSLSDAMSENLDAATRAQMIETARVTLMQNLAKEGLKVNKIFGDMADNIKSMLDDQETVEKTTKTIGDLEKERKDAIAEINKEFGVFGRSFEEYTNLARDPKMMGVVAMSALIAAVGKLGSAIRDTQKELGMNTAQSAKMGAEITAVNVQLKMMGVDAQEASTAVKSIYLNTALTGKEVRHAAMNVAVLTEAFGMSAEQAAEMTEASKEAGLNVDDMAISLAKSRDVAPAKVLSNMAGSMDEIARFGKEGAKSFVEAAMGASELGIELSSVIDAGRGLLDVESSIEKQMTAEVLLGRKLNLEKARSAALRGDEATVLKEILKNVGSIEQFQSMNVIEQQALADALNMSVPDIIKMAENQEKIKDLSAEARAHYEATGEILKENKTISEGAKQAMTQFGLAIAQAVAQAIILNKMNKWMGGGNTGGMLGDKQKQPEIKTDKTTTPGKTGGAMKGGIGNMIKGAAAILILSAALFVFALAAKQLSDEINWANVFIAIGALVLMAIVAAVLGQLAANILIGALAILVLAIALIPLAFAFWLIAEVPIGTMFAFIGAVTLLALIAAGLGFLAPWIFAGAAALAALGLGILPLALAFMLLENVDMAMVGEFFGTHLPKLVAIAPGLFLAGLGMAAFGFGVLMFAAGIAILSPFLETLIAFGIALPMLTEAILPLVAAGAGLFTVALGIGSIALSIAGLAVALLMLTPMLPTLLILGGVLGAAMVAFGGGGVGGGKKEDKNQAILDKLDDLIDAVKAGGVVNIDGIKAGEVIGLATGGGTD